MMGDLLQSGFENESPAHLVNISYDFLISKYQTTFSEFDEFCKETRRERDHQTMVGEEERGR